MTNEKRRASKVDSDEIWVTEFDEEGAQVFRNQVLKTSRMDPTAPIVVYIDSYGGLVDSLATMIETMDEVPNPFVTVAIGKAMSCGAILLSHGDIRWCGNHSRIMIHEVSGGAAGDVHDAYADIVETKRLNKHFMGLLAKNCGIEGGYEGLRKLIKGRDGRDLYLTASDAVEFGIVDAVGVPKVEPVVIYNVSKVPEKESFTMAPIKESAKPIRVKPTKPVKKSSKGKR